MSLGKNIRSKKYINSVMSDYGLSSQSRIGRNELNDLKENLTVASGRDYPIASREFIRDLEADKGVITPPVAAFNSARTGTASVTVFTFTNTSTGGALSYLWNFGDGITSTSATPTHSYTQSATYSVSLVATNIEGTDTESKSNWIVIS